MTNISKDKLKNLVKATLDNLIYLAVYTVAFETVLLLIIDWFYFF